MANDAYETWLTEKIWELIPAYYRHEDGLADPPGVLRALVSVMAKQGAILRRSQDRLWEDQSVETADEWALPYIAELVATRLLSALNPRGLRIDVAKTIYYRRRSGTLRVLEELASDIAGFEGKVVEEFRRLARARHGLDPAPNDLAGRFRGRFSGTPPGGTADLRRAVSAEATGTAYDEFHYTPDFRKPNGRLGRYGIAKLGVHLYRLVSYRVEGATPATVIDLGSGETIHCFDPSGRDIPLFQPASRPERWDDWQSAFEWELPKPMRCRILGHAEYLITDEVIGALRAETGLSEADAATLLPLRAHRFLDEARLSAVLGSLPNANEYDPSLEPERYRVLLREALASDTGKYVLLPNAVALERDGSGEVPREAITSGDLGTSGALLAVPARLWAIDPEHGRFAALDAASGTIRSVTYHYGFPGTIGAGPFTRGLLPEPTRTYGFDATGSRVLFDHPDDDAGVLEITDDATYDDVRDRPAVETLTIQARDGKRPFLQLGQDLRLEANAAGEAVLTLDGLYVGSGGAFEVRLAGDYESITVRHCTFDPGGFDAGGNVLHPVSLVVEGHVETLTVERSILASVRVEGAGVVERIELSDTIVAAGEGNPALFLPMADVHLARVTVQGEIEARRLHATEALLTGHVEIADTQTGCVRFSAYREGSRLPRPYESHATLDFGAFFTSRRFGDPTFFQLSAAAPMAVRRGAENGSEIGAYAGLRLPIKSQGLAAKVDEFLPFGLIPAFIDET